MQRWNDAIQKGDEASLNSFMQYWNSIKSNPQQYQNMTAQEQDDVEPWRVALVNQVDGQNTVASIVGADLTNELVYIRNQAMNVPPSNITVVLDMVMGEWKKINEIIGEQSQRPRNATNGTT